MSSVGNILLENEILLESGTNELEILVFRLADFTFGINVAKVREVLPSVDITFLPKAYQSVLGVFKLRDTVVPVVSLRKHLGVAAADASDEQSMILTDFNQHQTAFVVDTVERIHRISWTDILSVPSMESLAQTPVTAVARIEGRLIIMLDFEMISDQVTDQYFRTGAVENPLGLPREKLRILLADDSPTVRQAIKATLTSSGYTNLTFFENGGEAWNWIEAKINETGQASEVADLIVSDVEMPQIDGLHLTKRIKEHTLLKHIPVLLYSSIVTPDNKHKGDAVGADAQISKPELPRIVELADDLISKALSKHPAAAKIDNSAAPAPSQELKQPQTPKTETIAASQSAPPAAIQPDPPKQRVVNSPASPSPATESKNENFPNQINPNLWSTFRVELGDRVRHIGKLFERLSSGERDDELCNEVFRTLHTIKSAAMVVPVDPATRLTHLLESILEVTRADASQWPLEKLEKYIDWITELADSGSNVSAVFDAEPKLQQALSSD